MEEEARQWRAPVVAVRTLVKESMEAAGAESGLDLGPAGYGRCKRS
jgi:hypothetical protein